MNEIERLIVRRIAIEMKQRQRRHRGHAARIGDRECLRNVARGGRPGEHGQKRKLEKRTLAKAKPRRFRRGFRPRLPHLTAYQRVLAVLVLPTLVLAALLTLLTALLA